MWPGVGSQREVANLTSRGPGPCSAGDYAKGRGSRFIGIPINFKNRAGVSGVMVPHA
jgi:hypothetical protein